ncbi:ABC transporter ATP-binding protein [Nitratidesulfovibrio sp. 1201_IL3209]|uniref:ABC transporter ATP-binding protein n=1 Tax=Nitratidesulfovibrio sp. 1201_IL3209 TaxID=3084053 RepID=UPI002FD9F691
MSRAQDSAAPPRPAPQDGAPGPDRGVGGDEVLGPDVVLDPDGAPGAAPARAPRTASPPIRLEGVSKAYRRGAQVVPVLTSVNMAVAPGEFLALMGPSGSGKSTLLNLIAGIDRVDAGSIFVGGTDITTLDRSRSVGFIFQFYNLIPVLNAQENVELPLLLTPLSGRERRDRARTALSMVGLSDRLDHYPGQLSGGQQQRTAIARALVADPDILVADEPTGDLDRVSAGEILDLMDGLNRTMGKTIIMVTHDPRAAERAGRLLLLEKGELADAHP